MSDKHELANTLYVVKDIDNVATAMGDVPEGEARLIGGLSGSVHANEFIRYGYKIALRDIPEGEVIVKYGAPVARATLDIKKGDCVHIHNAMSLNDTRSPTFNKQTAAPQDRVYALDDE